MIDARIRHDKAKIVLNDQDAGFLANDGSTLAQDYFDNAGIFIDFDGEGSGRTVVVQVQPPPEAAGKKRKATAMLEPTSAIHTTETALGTRTAGEPKWSFASRKPNADDFIAVSIAIVRALVSPKLSAREAE